MKFTPALLLALCVAAGPAAQAQTTPAKPAAKPAAAAAAKPAGGNTLRMGGAEGGTGKAGSPILSRDELRVCLKEEEAVRTRLEEHEKARPPLDAEKAAIATEQAALRSERAQIDEAVKKGEEFKGRQAAYAAKVNDWNQRVQAHNENQTRNRAYEQTSQRLTNEKAELEKERGDLVAEVDRWSAQMKPAVDAYNVKAGALDARVAGWNERNAKWNESGAMLEAERKTWVAACADRRYREDDEKAIRAGK
jgi:hypothetical protein